MSHINNSPPSPSRVVALFVRARRVATREMRFILARDRRDASRPAPRVSRAMSRAGLSDWIFSFSYFRAFNGITSKSPRQHARGGRRVRSSRDDLPADADVRVRAGTDRARIACANLSSIRSSHRERVRRRVRVGARGIFRKSSSGRRAWALVFVSTSTRRTRARDAKDARARGGDGEKAFRRASWDGTRSTRRRRTRRKRSR